MAEDKEREKSSDSGEREKSTETREDRAYQAYDPSGRDLKIEQPLNVEGPPIQPPNQDDTSSDSGADGGGKDKK